MFVKICGLTNPEDTQAAVEAGARAVGFNFVDCSLRYIDPDRLLQWVREVPPHIWKVGVFADHPRDYILELSSRLSLDVAQLHGSETHTEIPPGIRVWKAIRITRNLKRPPLENFGTEAILLDGPASGIPFDWTHAQGHRQKVILAGGLDAVNVQSAVERTRPWGVDACSRLESAPGQKDHSKMRDFIQTALSC